MYQPAELAAFTLSEFERGLEGLSDEDARVRMKKADGSEMNAISWAIAHIAGHWLAVAAYASGEEYPGRLDKFSGPEADPTPPKLSDALKLLAEAKASIEWITEADESLLDETRGGLRLSGSHGNVGTAIMKAALHTWSEIGEINAVRQMLGHPTISFVGPRPFVPISEIRIQRDETAKGKPGAGSTAM